MASSPLTRCSATSVARASRVTTATFKPPTLWPTSTTRLSAEIMGALDYVNADYNYGGERKILSFMVSGHPDDKVGWLSAAHRATTPAAVASAGCDNDWSTWWLGSAHPAQCHQDFYLGVYVMYANLFSASLPGNNTTQGRTASWLTEAVTFHGRPRKARPGAVRKTPQMSPDCASLSGWRAERRPAFPRGNAGTSRTMVAPLGAPSPSSLRGDNGKTGLPGASPNNTGDDACLY